MTYGELDDRIRPHADAHQDATGHDATGRSLGYWHVLAFCSECLWFRWEAVEEA